MTALSSEDQRLRGEQLGADRYLVKSQVGIEDVVRTVHEVLADAPVASAGNAFAPNTPSAVAKPAPSAPAASATSATPAAPAIPAAPKPAEPAPQPSASTPPTPAPSPVPAPAPTIPPAPPVAPVNEPVAAAPAPTPAADSAASSLPQPTAPFSTARPAGLADRIIQPLERPSDPAQEIGDLMNKELGVSQPEAPTPDTPPAPAAEPAVPPSPPEDHGIAFEEIPRAPSQQ